MLSAVFSEVLEPLIFHGNEIIHFAILKFDLKLKRGSLRPDNFSR